MALDEVERDVGAGRWEAALTGALARWHVQRKAPLGRLIAAIGERVPRDPIRATGAAAFQQAWLSRANGAEPLDVGPLVEALARSLPQEQGRMLIYERGGARIRYAAWFDRLAALDGVVDDPRVPMALLRIVAKAPWTSYHRDDVASLYDPALAIVERIADEAALEEVLGMLARPTATKQSTREYLAGALPPLASALRRAQTRWPSLTTTENDLCERLTRKLKGGVAVRAAPRSDEDSLLERVIAHPEDDEAREVLADLWQERGDPRGTFVALQLQASRGKATAAGEKEARRLLRDHEKDWLGDIALVTTRRHYERGFLDAIELAQNSAAEPQVWERVPLDLRLRTVRRIAKGKANEAHYRRFVFSPAMRSLCELTVLSKAMLADARARAEPWPITHLHLAFVPDKKTFDAVVDARAFPALRSLHVGLRDAKVEELVALVAVAAKARLLESVAATPSRLDGDDSVALAEWLASSQDRLRHVPSIVLASPYASGPRFTARGGAKRPRLEIVATELELALGLVSHAVGWEEVTLRAPPGSGASDLDALHGRALLRKVPAANLRADAAWAEKLGIDGSVP